MSDDDSGGCCDGTSRGSPDEFVRDPDASEELDRYLDVLADRRRRHLLYYLAARQDEAVERDELAEAVCDYEIATAESGDAADPDAVSTDLHHRVLPRLDDEAVVDYDSRQGTVRADPNPVVEELLSLLFEHEIEDGG